MVKNNTLGHLKFWLLWDVDDKIISISAVVGHRVIFLDQAKEQDFSYSIGVIPIQYQNIQGGHQFFGVCHSCVTMDT